MKNKEEKRQYLKMYYIKNRETILINTKKYRITHKKEKRIYNDKYWIKNKENLLLQQREFYKNNKEKIKENRKKYCRENKEKIKEYLIKNRNKLSRKANIYQIKKRKIDIQFKLRQQLRCRLNRALKRNFKTGSAVKDLGCSIDKFKKYLENLFQPDMTWSNWTQDGWHIHHKSPLAGFDLTDRNQFLQAVHYTNLQPMWAFENLSKGKIIT